MRFECEDKRVRSRHRTACPLKELEDFTSILSCFVGLEMVLNFINTEEISSRVELLEGCVNNVNFSIF